MGVAMDKLAAFARRHRRRLIAGGGAIVFIAAVLIVLPYGVRYALADWLRQDGARTATIAHVSIDYLEPSIEITGLDVRDPDGKVLRFGRIALSVDVSALWNRHIHVRALSFADGRVEIEQTKDGTIRLAGIPMGSSEPPPKEAGEPSRWQIGLDATAIDGVIVAFHAPGGSQEFTVDNARLGAFAMWSGDARTALQFAMAFGGGSLKVGGEATPLGTEPAVELDLDVAGFDLSRARPIPGLQGLAGTLSGRLKLSARSSADKGPQLKVAGNLAIEGLELADRPGHPTLASLAWTGEADFAASPKGAATGRIRGTLALGKLAADKNSFASANFTDLDARASFDAAKGLDAEVSGALDVAGADLDLGSAKGGGDRLRWKGTIHAASARDDSYRIEAKGNFEALAAAYASEAASLVERSELSAARFAIDGLDAKIEKNADGSIRLDLAGGFGVTGAKGSAAGDGFAEDSAAWTGTVGVLAEPGKAPEVALDGALDSKGIALDLKSAGFKIAQREIQWRGTAKLGGDGGTTMAATVQSSGTSIDAPEQKLRLLDLERVTLDNLTMAPAGRIAIGRLKADGVRAIGPTGATDPSAFAAVVGALRADAIDFDGALHLKTRRIAVNDAAIGIERDDKGALRMTGILAALIGGGGGAATESGTPFRVEIGEATLGGKSRIDFVDHSVDPTAKIALGPVALHLGALDTAAADRPVPVELTADIGRYAKLELKGSAKPFAKKLDVDVQGKIAGFELTSLSGYMSQFLGYDLSRGRLDTELHVKIVDGALQSTSQLTITNLAVKPTESDALHPLKKHLEIPIETALSLLRDSDDVIRLSLPVTGDIANPDFDLSDAINTAIGNAMKQTLMTMLTIVFPVGGLIMAIDESSGDKALKFQPVLFEGGEVDLSDGSKTLLDAVAKLLEARPGVKITTCGVATERDAADILRVRKEKAAAEAKKKATIFNPAPKPDDAAPVTRDELYDLSQRRGEAVKDYLIARPHVDETRVFVCAPNVAKDAAAEPHTDITL